MKESSRSQKKHGKKLNALKTLKTLERKREAVSMYNI